MENESSTHPTEGRSESTSEQAKDKTRQAAGQAQEKAGQLAEQAKEKARSQLSHQKDRATEQLGSVSSALHQTSDNLRGEDQQAVAGYVDSAARQVDRFSGYLRNHSADELISEARHYARREPSLFLGGAMLLGLVGARFFKSSERGRQRHPEGMPPARYEPRRPGSAPDASADRQTPPPRTGQQTTGPTRTP